MKSKFIILLVTCTINCITAFNQPMNDSITPYLETGFGYLNDEFMIDGSVLWSEIGLKLKNNYAFSLNVKFAEILNDRANFIFGSFETHELINTTKLFSLYTGYDFSSKKGNHRFLPRFGPFFCIENIQTVKFDMDQNAELYTSSFQYIGVAVKLSYQYQFKSGVSVGICGSGYLAYQYGYLYTTVSPFISIRL